MAGRVLSFLKSTFSLNDSSDTPVPSLEEQVLGVIIGNCVGDTLGLLTEFMVPREAKVYYGKYKNLEFEHKVPDMHRDRWKVGDWTDDSDQMLLILISLVEKGEIDAKDFGLRLLNWSRKGFPELGDFAGMGIGAHTKSVLSHKKYLEDPIGISEFVWEDGGRRSAANGGVMRTSILGVYQYDDIEKVIENTRTICKASHPDPRCQASCVAVTTAIALMLQRQHKHFRNNKYHIHKIMYESYEHAKKCLEDPEHKKELCRHMFAKRLNDLKLGEYKKIGYTFKCMGAGFWAIRQNNYRQALQKVVMASGDADTNGAVAGAMIGCKLGLYAIPETWRNKLYHKEWLQNHINRFFDFIKLKPIQFYDMSSANESDQPNENPDQLSKSLPETSAEPSHSQAVLEPKVAGVVAEDKKEELDVSSEETDNVVQEKNISHSKPSD